MNKLITVVKSFYQSFKFHEDSEVLAEKYMKAEEIRMNLQEAKEKIQEIEDLGMARQYENQIRSYFTEGLCNVSVVAEKEDYTKALESLVFDAEIYSFMGNTLVNTSLINNVDYMTVTTNVEKLDVVHVVEFELKSSGQNWSSSFSKFISKEIFQKIECLDGKMDGHHVNNLTLIKDTFTLVFSHKRLEVLANKEMESLSSNSSSNNLQDI